jgi:hypothetical protein
MRHETGLCGTAIALSMLVRLGGRADSCRPSQNGGEEMKRITLFLLVLATVVLSAASADAQVFRRRVVYQDPYTWTYPTTYYSSGTTIVENGNSIVTATPTVAPTTTVNPVVQTSYATPGVVYYNTPSTVYYQYPAGGYYWSSTYNYPYVGRVGFFGRWR